jgi:hypothetical protein
MITARAQSPRGRAARPVAIQPIKRSRPDDLSHGVRAGHAASWGACSSSRVGIGRALTGEGESAEADAGARPRRRGGAAPALPEGRPQLGSPRLGEGFCCRPTEPRAGTGIGSGSAHDPKGRTFRTRRRRWSRCERPSLPQSNWWLPPSPRPSPFSSSAVHRSAPFRSSPPPSGAQLGGVEDGGGRPGGDDGGRVGQVCAFVRACSEEQRLRCASLSWSTRAPTSARSRRSQPGGPPARWEPPGWGSGRLPSGHASEPSGGLGP